MKKQESVLVGEDLFFDFLIIGNGIAGASLALKLAHQGSVALLCKETMFDSNTLWAQGGIASVFLDEDSFDAHVQDTLIAGADLCHEDIVRQVVQQGPKSIQELINLGVEFTQNHTEDNSFQYHLTREGGHSARRIIHAQDMTGAAIQKVLVEKLTENKNIQIFEHHTAIDIIVTDKVAPDFSRNRALGAYVLNEKQQKINSFLAKATVIATGGHGQLYLHTSNPSVATGDGVAMASRAGARVANLEFMQFHPTCLYDLKVKNFLISEALRGEGALLLSKDGRRFMEGIDPRCELAPRDIVARAIDSEIKKTGENHVFLDISHKNKDFVIKHFPGIYAKCLEVGIDITKDPIPVVPAAHYSCGGIVTDHRGNTGIKSLWAMGEVACTGLHGANRLASNSLLEGLVFSDFVLQDILNNLPELKRTPHPLVPKWSLGKAGEPDEMVVISQLFEEIRHTMWNYVGIVRSDKRLARAAARIEQIDQEIKTFYWDILPSRSLIEVRNLARVAKLTVQCARLRKESRGIHFSIDYPFTDNNNFKKDTVII